MRKKLALVLVASMAFATFLTGCSKDSNEEKETTKKVEESSKDNKEDETPAPQAEATELADVDASTGFMAGKTDWITLTGDFELKFTFKHEGYLSAAQNAYENVIVEFSTEGINDTANDASNYYTVVCNGAAWNWNGANVADAAKNWTGTPANTFTAPEGVDAKDILSSADATVVIKREGNKLSINGTFVNGDKEGTWAAEVEEANLPESINVHLGGECCKLTNIKYTK